MSASLAIANSRAMANATPRERTALCVACVNVPVLFLWVVVMAWSAEWPTLADSQYLRRYDGRAFSRTVGYSSIGDMLEKPITGCPGSPPLPIDPSVLSSTTGWEWICGNIDGTAAHLDPIGDWQIAALSLVPVLWLLMGVQVRRAVPPGRGGCAVAVVFVLLLVLGLFVGITLVVTADMLSEFNATGGGVVNVTAPGDGGWRTSPGMMKWLGWYVVALTGLAVVATAIAVACRNDVAEQDAVVEGPADTAGAAPIEAEAVEAGATPVEAYVVDGTAVDAASLEPTAPTAGGTTIAL